MSMLLLLESLSLCQYAVHAVQHRIGRTEDSLIELGVRNNSYTLFIQNYYHLHMVAEMVRSFVERTAQHVSKEHRTLAVFVRQQQ